MNFEGSLSGVELKAMQSNPTIENNSKKDNKSFVRCRFCTSENVIKFGARTTKTEKKQRYKCKDCNKRFTVNDGFLKMKNAPKIITLALDLYFKGLSLRKITDHIKQFHGLGITHITILKWIRKYSLFLKKFTEKFKTKSSGILNADEMMIKINGEWVWLWNVLDKETRFLLSNLITKTREIKDARQVFRKAKKVIKEKPEKIITDGLWSYEDAIKKEFLTWRHPKTEHIRLAGISKRINNNTIERFQGTVRERDKVLRGFKVENSARALLEGYSIYYNFIRPHESLNGLTPAQAAGIDLQLNGGNRWLELINLAVNEENNGEIEEEKYPWLLGIKRPKKRRYRRIKYPKITYMIQVFTSDNKEIKNPKCIKTEFSNYEKAQEFAMFYKEIFSKFSFVISEKSTFTHPNGSETFELKTITSL